MGKIFIFIFLTWTFFFFDPILWRITEKFGRKIKFIWFCDWIHNIGNPWTNVTLNVPPSGHTLAAVYNPPPPPKKKWKYFLWCTSVHFPIHNSLLLTLSLFWNLLTLVQCNADNGTYFYYKFMQKSPLPQQKKAKNLLYFY